VHPHRLGIALGPQLPATVLEVADKRTRRAFCQFRPSRGHRGVELSQEPMGQPDAWRMIRRRAAAIGIAAPISNHSVRATGITAYLSNGGALERAQEMAAHESPRTAKLYDRTKEWLTQDEVERIRL
jgi:site-specific recombinase XerD